MGIGDRQLGPEELISESYDKINQNAEETGDHIDGSAHKHNNGFITDISNYSQGTTAAVLNLIKLTLENHFNGIANKHGSGDIDNDSTVGDGGSGDISGVVENLQAQITALVLGGTETDPRLTQALVDFENTDWTSQGFKALQDFWQERIVILEKSFNSGEIITQQLTQNTSVKSFELNGVGFIELSVPGKTITNHMGVYGLSTARQADRTLVDIGRSADNLTGTVYLFSKTGYDLSYDLYNLSDDSYHSGSHTTQSGAPIVLPSGTYIKYVFGDDINGWDETSFTDAIKNFEVSISNENISNPPYINGTQDLADVAVDIRSDNLIRESGPITNPWAFVTPSFNGEKIIFKNDGISRSSGYWKVYLENGKDYRLTKHDENVIAGSPLVGAKVSPVNDDFGPETEIGFSQFTWSGNTGEAYIRPYTADSVQQTIEVNLLLEEITPNITGSYMESKGGIFYSNERFGDGDRLIINSKNGQALKYEVQGYIDLSDIEWVHTVSVTGIKIFNTKNPIPNSIADNFSVICNRFDSKLLKGAGNVSTAADLVKIGSDNKIYLSVSNSISGMGDSFTPDDNEVNAFMKGYVLRNSLDGNLYNGSGDKIWAKRFQDIGTPFTTVFGAVIESGSDLTNITPTEKTYGHITRAYKLRHNYLKPILKEIDNQGQSPTFSGRFNQIAVLTGIRREKASISLRDDGIIYSINLIGASDQSDSPQSKSVLEFIELFSIGNGKEQILSEWIKNTSNTYGNERLYITADNFNHNWDNNLYCVFKTLPSENDNGLHSSTLVFEDSTKNTIDSLLGLVGSLFEKNQQLRSELNEIKSGTKIIPTLINNWVNTTVSGDLVTTCTIKMDRLEILILAKGGASDSVLFNLPRKPRATIVFDGIAESTTGEYIPVSYLVKADGTVTARFDGTISYLSGVFTIPIGLLETV